MCKSSPRNGCGSYGLLGVQCESAHPAFECASSHVYPCSVLCPSMHWELHQVSYIFGPTLHLRLLYWATHQYVFEYIFENISLNIYVAQLCIWGYFIGPLKGSSGQAVTYTLLACLLALFCVYDIPYIFCEFGFCICKMYRIIFALCIALYLECFWYWMCTVHSIVFVYCIVFGHPDLRQFPPILFDFLHSRRRCIACPYTLR